MKVSITPDGILSLVMTVMLGAGISWGAEPLATLDYTVSGQVMQVTPAALSVPKGIPGSIGVSIPGETPPGAFVEATLRGPSFPARCLVGAPNAPLLLPPLNLVGDYSLDGIRLVAATGETLLEGNPSTVPVRVFDEVLVSRVTSRPLSLDEIQERGIEIDDTNFRAVEFEVAFVVDGISFPVRLPVIAPNFSQTTEIIPAAELKARLAEVELLNQQLGEAVGLPPALERVMPNIQVKGINFQFGGGVGDGDLALQIPPIPALMVIPGNIGFLNQFFSVMVFTENAAPAGSGLSVHSLTAEMILPPGPDQVAGTNSSPGDDPLRMARVNGEARAVVPVRAVGPDGKTATSDDVDRLQAGGTGQGELLVEGLQEGLHVMELALKAKLDGLAAGSVEITGKAAGSILVRNPMFSMAFIHPRTVRSGEPYNTAVTILNTSSTVANLVSVELNENNISGGVLETGSRVELGTIAPGETKTATFRIRSQKTGAITFSNLTTSDDSVVGRFRLKTGVDERGVALSSDTLLLPDFIDALPPDLLAAAQRVLGQALSTNTAGQLPPGVLRVAKRMVSASTTMNSDGKPVYRGSGSRLMELLEAAQRVRYGEPLARVLPDLMLDWQGGREFDEGWDQLIRETDAGREWREALMLAMEQANPGPDHAVARLVARNRDFAGRGETRLVAASDRGSIDLSYRSAAGKAADASRSTVAKTAGYGGADGDWLVAAESGVLVWKLAAPLAGEGQFSVALIRADGTARELLWRIGDLPAGACVIFDANGGNELAGIDANGDGTPEQTVAAQGLNFTELPPEVLVVMQDPEVKVGRPSKPCLQPMTTNDRDENVSVNNYANVVAVLFSKPMTQDTANVPDAYLFENGNEAAFVQVQPGGRVALLTMRQPLGALVPRSLTVTGSVKDTRGNAMASSLEPVFSRLVEGVSVKGRVIRADGSYAANVPVTLTYHDEVDGLFGCLDWTRRTAQTRTDANGGFNFDFVIGGISYSLSATDTSSLSEEAIDLILQSSVKGQVDGDKLMELANLPQNQNTLLAEFAAGALPAAIAKAEGLDRAIVTDSAQADRYASESVYALRFRGRGTVTGRVVLADGQTPVPNAAVNLFPDVNSRELGRGILSDNAGRFAFYGVPLGPFSIEALTSTGLTRTVSGLVEETGGAVDVVISLGATPPSYSDWQGRVTEADGSGVAGAPVYVGQFVESTFIASGQTVADASGYWSISDLPVESYVALAFSLDGKRKGTRGPLTSVANTLMTANVVLQSRAVVEGVVQFANGDPVQGAVVGGGDRLVTTDSLGRFTLPGVPTGNGTISAGYVGIEGHVDPRKQLTRLGSANANVQASDNFVVIRFEAIGRIIGTVRDAAGQPVPDMNVALPYPFEDEPFFLWVKSNAQGVYEFPGLGLKGPISGAYDVSAPSPPVEEPFDGEGAAAALLGASSEEIAAIIGEAFAAFTGVNNPLLTGGALFNPNVFGFKKAVKLNFDGATEVADITYLGPSKISGTVLNGQGVPIGARVRLTGIGPNNVGYPTFITRAELNSDPALGTFEFNGQAFVGDWGLQAASPFFPTVIATSGRTTSIAPNATGLVLQFPRVQEINGSLTGEVLLSDGSPAGGNVEVSITANVATDDPRVLRTDPNGRFTTGAALYSLRGNTNYTVTVFDPVTGGKARANLHVNAGQDNALSITLLSRGDLEVLVLRADGSRAVGAAVEAKGGQFPNEMLDGLTDSQGRIVFSNLYAGPFGVCAEQTIGLTRVAGRAGAVVSHDQTTNVTVRLSSTATLTGIFVESDGVTPVVGANVRLGSLAFAPTNLQGRFTFADVPLGAHVLTAVNPVNGRGGNITVQLVNNGQTIETRIVEAPLGVVQGLVLNAVGTGVETNAEVELNVDDPFALTRSFRVTSGPDGAYSVAGVVPGGFTVSARSRLPNGQTGNDSGLVRAVMPATATRLNVDVPLDPRGSIEVLVLRPDGLAPAANAQVILFSNGQFAQTRDADAAGVAVFNGLGLSLNYQVQALDTTLGETSSRSRIHNVSLSDRGQIAMARLTLRGIGTVNGVVFEANGTTPAAGAEVRMEVSQAREMPVGGTSGLVDDRVTPIQELIVVGPDGAFSFKNLPTGLPVMLRATRLGLAASETVNGVGRGETVTRDLLLTASGTVAGRILRQDGRTLAVGTEVSVRFPSRSGAQGAILRITDSAGRFEISPVPEGPWSLSAVFPSNGGLGFAEGSIVGNGEVDDLGDLVLDESFPTVVSTLPADSDDRLNINGFVQVTFSEPMKAASINATGVFLRPAAGGAVVPATLSQTQVNVVRITPLSPLQSETTYQIIVVDGELKNAIGQVTNTGPQDLVNRSLLGLFSASFTTRDQRPPVLLSFTPLSGSLQVDPQNVLRLSFDEPIQPGAVIALSGPGGPVSGTTTLGVNNLVLTFVPNVPLPVNASFTATVSGVQDLAGNAALAQPIATSFATLDTLGPEIAELRIKGGSTPVAGAAIVLEAVLATPETGVRYRLSSNAVTVGTSSGNLLEVPFTLPQLGSLVFRGIAIDRFGNEGPLAELSVNVLPNAPPTISLTRINPASGPVPTGSAVSVRVSATDDSSVSQLKAAMTGAAPAALSASAGTDLTLTAVVKSTAGSDETITVVAQATDSSGVSTGQQSFTISISDGTVPALALDGVAPTGGFAPGAVVSIPVHGTDNFGIARYTITASGAISGSAEVLLDPVGKIDTRVLSFTMPENTPITGAAFTLTVVAEDAAGFVSSALVLDLKTVDLTAPKVIAFNLLNDADNLHTRSTLSISFSEALDPETVTSESVMLLRDPGGIPVSAAVSLNAAGTVATLSPASVPLAAGTSYRFVATTALTDLAGNPLAAEASASITTATFGITAPLEGTKVVEGRPVTISIMESFGFSSEVNVRFFVAGNQITTDVQRPFAAAVTVPPLTSIPDGILALRADLFTGGSTYCGTATVHVNVFAENDDTDGDGWLNGFEADRGMNPFVANEDEDDFDNDGLTNGQERALGTDPGDPDTDGDDLSDGDEVVLGADPLEPDSDGDGLPDGAEVAAGTNPLSKDTDGDSIVDAVDPFPLRPNRAPLAGDDLLQLATGNSVTFSVASLLSNDTDPDGDAVSFVSVSQPASGSVVDLDNGSFRFTPAVGFTGTQNITYTIRDVFGLQSAGLIRVTVSAAKVLPLDTLGSTNAFDSQPFGTGSIGASFIGFSSSDASASGELSAVAFTVPPQSDVTVDSIAMALSQNFGAVNVKISILENNASFAGNGSPSDRPGNVLAVVATNPSIAASPSVKTFVPASTVTLRAGIKYWLQIEPVVTSGSGGTRWHGNFNSPSSRGTVAFGSWDTFSRSFATFTSDNTDLPAVRITCTAVASVPNGDFELPAVNRASGTTLASLGGSFGGWSAPVGEADRVSFISSSGSGASVPDILTPRRGRQSLVSRDGADFFCLIGNLTPGATYRLVFADKQVKLNGAFTNSSGWAALVDGTEVLSTGPSGPSAADFAVAMAKQGGFKRISSYFTAAASSARLDFRVDDTPSVTDYFCIDDVRLERVEPLATTGWKRQEQWSAGPAAFSSTGNPAPDGRGNNVWSYQWTNNISNTSTPFHSVARTQMVWDSSWNGIAPGWASGNDTVPFVGRYLGAVAANFRQAPVIGWIMPPGAGFTVAVTGNIELSWWAPNGVPFPHSVLLAMVKVDTNGTATELLTRNVSPNQGSFPGEVTIPVNFPSVAMQAGDRINVTYLLDIPTSGTFSVVSMYDDLVFSVPTVLVTAELPAASLGEESIRIARSFASSEALFEAISSASPKLTLDKKATEGLVVNYSVARGTSPPIVQEALVGAGDSGVTLPTLLPSRTDALAPTEVVRVQLVAGKGYELGTTTEKVYVLTGSDFARWQASQFSSDQLLAGAADPLADTDHDGESAVLEFAMGGQGRLVSRGQVGGVVFDFLRRSGAVVHKGGIADVAGLRYLLETSSDLKTWKTTGEDVELVATHATDDPDYERVTVRLRGMAKFVRIKVQPTPQH
jgi:hypothetical protein